MKPWRNGTVRRCWRAGGANTYEEFQCLATLGAGTGEKPPPPGFCSPSARFSQSKTVGGGGFRFGEYSSESHMPYLVPVGR